MSIIVDISKVNKASPNQEKQNKHFFISNVGHFVGKHHEQHAKRVIHGIKVGTALVLVSFLYLLDPLFEQFGQNAMWAIMTVVVVYDFYADLVPVVCQNGQVQSLYFIISIGSPCGATLSKGLLRGVGTILGGVIGCLVSSLAEDSGKIGNTIVVGTSVFTFGAMVTYSRTIPSIKKKYDYGFMIFILTFNLVAVSGLRANKILELASERLTTIGMGFTVCIFTSLLIFPMWASDELHRSTSSKFNKLACCIEECLEVYFSVHEKEGPQSINISSCKSMLHSKSTDESLANFARWEPWHGKFGFYYPWKKYLQIGELLRELASIILSLQACSESPLKNTTRAQEVVKKTCLNIGMSLGDTMRELGDNIIKMRRGRDKILILLQLQSTKLELNTLSTSELGEIENVEALAIANRLFLLKKMIDKVKVLSKEVEELGEVAGFQCK